MGAMTIQQLLILALVFIAVFGLAFGIIRLFTTTPLQARIETVAGRAVVRAGDEPNPWIERVVKMVGPLAKLSVPDEGWEASAIRTRFMNAGIRNSYAPALYFIAKTALAACLPLAAFMFVGLSGAKYGTNQLLFLLLLSAAIGYYLPNLVLKRLVFLRQREIFENFPDALDLMMVCVEAGLAIDAAIARVAEDMQLKSPALGEELHLVTLELRAGAPKEKALRNLAMRTGVEEIDSLVAMLIQAERFGTSIADSLRVQSDMLRTKRRQKAEEQAAKIALKLLFPLIFNIFPALMMVLLGPAFIQIYRVMLPTMAGQ